MESRNRERLLKTILDTIDVGIVAVDADGQKVLVNDQQQSFRQAAAPAGTEQPQEAQQLMFGQDRVTPLPVDKRPIRRAVAGETFADYLVWLGEGPRSGAPSPLLPGSSRTTTAGSVAPSSSTVTSRAWWKPSPPRKS